jgi:ferrous iron transport protein A
MLTGAMLMSKRQPVDTYPLTFAARGETVTLIEIRAGDRLRRRLKEMGLNIGMRVRIVQGDLNGPVILAVANDTRLAIGQGMAQKIMVRRHEREA